MRFDHNKLLKPINMVYYKYNNFCTAYLCYPGVVFQGTP